MNAVAGAYGVKLEPTELAVLCQITENHVVGAPCGVMDQMTSVCGRENELMALLCRPAELLEPVAIPASIGFWGIDSGVRHAVSGADYGTVRTAAFIGYRMIADIAGLAVTLNGAGRVVVDDPRWHGYLAALRPSEFARKYQTALPDRISGAEFLARFGGITDPVTQVRPEAEYPVAASTAHAVNENHRVHLFRALLRGEMSDDTLDQLGELMFQSHASYAACGLTEDGTDLLVELVTERRADGVFGAKITGGGSGGTVAVLARRESSRIVSEIAADYAARSGRKSYILSGSSPGAGQFGVLRLTRA
jgi:L-arabinokinase